MEVGGQKCRKSRCRKPRFEFRTPRLCLKNEDDILNLKLKYLHMTVCLLFFRESLRHLEMFSGIVHELIKLFRAKLTEILTYQKRTLNVYEMSFFGGILPLKSDLFSASPETVGSRFRKSKKSVAPSSVCVCIYAVYNLSYVMATIYVYTYIVPMTYESLQVVEEIHYDEV